MGDVVISVEDLSKQYRLGEVSTGSIAHDINRWWHRLRGNEDPYLKIGETNDRTQKGNSEYVWALQDVNFEVKRGEALGIIGRNGAGKSTLLKILSRTTLPTLGHVKIKGRVASLLEVGTGFHPELTGRDNIFLNGAILGMTKGEIKKKFDEIVDFSGVERYIDTPVKRYSSGMYVRLAFGVAAHLEPDILVVDEVLAVGDLEFQKKCIGKMKDVSNNQGRTVLFVSHQMGSIAQLCTNGLFMNNGQILANGKIEYVIEKYLSANQDSASSYFINDEETSDKEGLIKAMRIVDKKGDNTDILGTDDKIIIEIEIKVAKWYGGMELALSLQDFHLKRIFTIHKPLNEIMEPAEKQKKIVIEIPSNFIVPGKYSWIGAINIPGSKLVDVHWNICGFKIVDSGSEFAKYENLDYGYVFVNNYSIRTQ